MLQKKKRNIEKRNNMKLINQSYEICKTHGYTLQDVYKDIERAARVSYKSEDKITEDSKDGTTSYKYETLQSIRVWYNIS